MFSFLFDCTADLEAELARKRYEMRKLFTYMPYSGYHFDDAANTLLKAANIELAEDFIEVLKASPLYNKKVCEVTRKKLEAKRAEVLALEKTLTGDCM